MAVFDSLDADVDRLLGLNFDALTTPERLALLARCEKVRRRLPAAERPLINQLARQATPDMSYLVATPEIMTEAATHLAGIGSDLGAAHVAASAPTLSVLSAAADEVSASIAQVSRISARTFRIWQLRQRRFSGTL